MSKCEIHGIEHRNIDCVPVPTGPFRNVISKLDGVMTQETGAAETASELAERLLDSLDPAYDDLPAEDNRVRSLALITAALQQVTTNAIAKGKRLGLQEAAETLGCGYSPEKRHQCPICGTLITKLERMAAEPEA